MKPLNLDVTSMIIQGLNVVLSIGMIAVGVLFAMVLFRLYRRPK